MEKLICILLTELRSGDIVTPLTCDDMNDSSDFQNVLSYDWLTRSWRSTRGGVSMNKLPGFHIEYWVSIDLKGILPW